MEFISPKFELFTTQPGKAKVIILFPFPVNGTKNWFKSITYFEKPFKV